MSNKSMKTKRRRMRRGREDNWKRMRNWKEKNIEQ
jgi:hypothetical protein